MIMTTDFINTTTQNEKMTLESYFEAQRERDEFMFWGTEFNDFLILDYTQLSKWIADEEEAWGTFVAEMPDPYKLDNEEGDDDE